MELNWTESFCFLRNGRQKYHPNFKFPFSRDLLCRHGISQVKVIPISSIKSHHSGRFIRRAITSEVSWFSIRGEDWEGYFWIGEWCMAKLKWLFFKCNIWLWYSWTVGVKFWVFIFKSAAKTISEHHGFKSRPLSHQYLAQFSTFELGKKLQMSHLSTKLFIFPRSAGPLGPHSPRWTKILGRFRNWSCHPNVCVSHQKLRPCYLHGQPRRWWRQFPWWLGEDGVDFSRGECLKEKGNFARRWWKDVKSRSFFFKIWLWS